MKNSDFLVGLAVGALVGAALGFIYAPQPGEETRSQVAEGARKLKEAAAQRGRLALHRVKETEEAGEGEADRPADGDLTTETQRPGPSLAGSSPGQGWPIAAWCMV